MSKIYAVIGTNSMTVVADSVRYTPATGEVLMQGERPDGDYVASEDGTWKKNEPSKQERLAALDAQYDTDKATLVKYYGEALLANDTDEQEEIRAELADIDAKYKAERKAIEGE